MSNKKRINRKINILRSKILSKNIQSFSESLLEFKIIIDDFSDAINYFMAHNINLNVLKETRQVLFHNEYIFDFSVEMFDNETEEFIHKTRLVCNKNYNEIKNICLQIPEKLRNDFIALVSVGFSAEDAIQELKDAYKF